MKNTYLKVAAFSALACTLAFAPARATVGYTTAGTPVVYESDNITLADEEKTFDGDVSQTDLIEAGATSLASGPTYSDTTVVSATGGINDGLVTSFGEGNQGNFGPHDTFLAAADTVTFDLTGPYDINQIQLISGYSGGFANQSFTLSFETTSSPNTFVPLTGIITKNGTAQIGDIFTNTDGFQAAETEITDTAGPIASDVTAIRFSFAAGGLILREVDIFGSPALVPEPSTWALMFAGLVCLLGVRRFARQD